REGAGLFMPHMDPIDLAAVDGVSDPVHRVADDPVARLHAGCLQRIDQYIGYPFGHSGSHVSFGYTRELTRRYADLSGQARTLANTHAAASSASIERVPRSALTTARDRVVCGAPCCSRHLGPGPR